MQLRNSLSVLLLLAATAMAAEKKASPAIWLHERVTAMPGLPLGPFVRLPDGKILGVDAPQDLVTSSDEGRTWDRRTGFLGSPDYSIRPERALFCTPGGVVILAFANDKERAGFKWDPKTSDSPGAKLPTYAVRSPDGGRSWQKPQKLHDDWTGAIRDVIQTRGGTIVFTSMKLLHDPGRHSVVSYSSKDEGLSWRRSNTIDLGGIGHHGGATEATLEQLRDGRLWMLLRTNWKVFWEAFSEDDGVSWRTIRPSTFDASSAPGLLKRLKSGRLVLIWNRYFPEGKKEFPLTGGDNQFSEVPVSNHRLELSIMFSDDDGRTWTRPVVLARSTKGWIAYPYLFEPRPGELWITTMQGGLRAKLAEKDFLSK